MAGRNDSTKFGGEMEWATRTLPHVLIVEDDPALCHLIRNTFIVNGYAVEAVHTRADARRLFDTGAYGMAILDYILPDGYGDELLDFMLAARPETLCVMITGAQKPQLVTEWTRRGAAAFVSKPFDPAYLLDLCTRVSQERALLRMSTLLAERMAEAETLTAQSQQELAAAQRLNAFQAQILKSVGEAVVATDLNGTILYWGRGAETLYGYRAEEVLRQPYRRFAGRVDPVDEDAFRTLLIENGGWRGEHLQRRRDGTTFWSDVYISILKNEAGQPIGFIGIDHDLTEQKRTAEMLEQSQRLESIGRLAGGVAHDFNNMLSVILGGAEFAMEGLDPESPLYATLREIEDAAKHSAELTRHLLAFARQQTAQPQALNLNTTVEETLPILRRLLGETVVLEWIPDPNGPWVYMDPAQVKQILTNLCVNARDALHGRGGIAISTSCATLDKSTWPDRGTSCVPGEYAALSVRDGGCGMDHQTIQHLFEPFFTTKEAGMGTGLGLATVYGIVQQNGGAIHVRSDPGKGTCITIYVPRLSGSGETPATEVQSAEARDAPAADLHVLLVEDETQVRLLAERRLLRLGYRVTSTGSADEALSLIHSGIPPVDVLITDVVMPGMNGQDLVKTLRARHPYLPCICMSGYNTGDRDSDGKRGPEVLYLQKPFTCAELKASIHTSIQRCCQGH